MANFHLESKIHGKKTKSGDTKSVSSVVAYRHCFAMGGFDYTNKSGMIESFMMVPEEIVNKTINSPLFQQLFGQDPELKEQIINNVKNGNVQNFWQAIEAKEKRKDAQFCEELIISLQHELSLEENIKNLKALVQENYIKRGLAADICIHNPGDNLHAHVLISQRPVEAINVDLVTGEATYEFGNKLRDQHFNKGFKLDQITPVREMWANLCNESFKMAGLDVRVSDKSLKVQREIALAEGNEQLAAELDREPAEYIYRGKDKALLAQIAAVEEHNAEEMENAKIMNGRYQPKLIEVPVLISFEKKLELRKERRIKEITENVIAFLKDRINKYATSVRRFIDQTIESAPSFSSFVRDKQERIRRRDVVRSFEAAKANIRVSFEDGANSAREFEDVPVYQGISQTKSAQRLSVEEEISREVDEKLATLQQEQKRRKGLWYDPFKRPTYTPFGDK